MFYYQIYEDQKDPSASVIQNGHSVPYTQENTFSEYLFMEHLQKTASRKCYIDVSDLFIFNFG